MRPFIRLPWKEVAFFGELQASDLGGVSVIVFAVSLALVEISEIVAYGPSAALEGSRDSGQTGRIGTTASRLPARQRICLGFIEFAHLQTIEARLLDFEHGSSKERGRHVLDRKAKSFGDGIKPFVSEAAFSLNRLARVKPRAGTIVENGHN
ncbi:UNVERIFIED_ORG: hypothetical protein GGE64_001170 [Rhizobium etli]|uniref:hypothetical protein n=1 Tax=Rhizobium TaxID=379 RepID=UPI0013DE2720